MKISLIEARSFVLLSVCAVLALGCSYKDDVDAVYGNNTGALAGDAFTSFKTGSVGAALSSKCVSCHFGGSGRSFLVGQNDNDDFASAFDRAIKKRDGSTATTAEESDLYSTGTGGNAHTGGSALGDVASLVKSWILLAQSES